MQVTGLSVVTIYHIGTDSKGGGAKGGEADRTN